MSKTWGNVLFVVGLGVILYTLNMKVSVTSPYGEINNFGLMNERQNYLILGGLASVVGIIISFMNGRESLAIGAADSKKCPACAELIKVEAAKCRHCGETFSTDDIAESLRLSHKAEQERRNGPLPKWVTYVGVLIVAALCVARINGNF